MRIERHLGELAAAHRLLNHGGSCELLHGHNWGITVWVEAPVGEDSGIAVDFLAFDRLWRALLEELDHGIWLNEADPLVRTLESGGVSMKLLRIPGEPTAENMARLILDRLMDTIRGGTRYGVRVSEMTGCTAEVNESR